MVAGYEPTDLLQSLLMILTQVAEGRAAVENQHGRIVPEHGNPVSLAAIADVYERGPSFERRGLGDRRLGLRIRPKYKAFDTDEKFGIGCATARAAVLEFAGCECGKVMVGKLKPTRGPQFGKGCSPDMPLGALMVSPEGACAAYWHYAAREAAE